MPPLLQYLRVLFGRNLGDHDFVALFSAHLDETGTHAESPYTVIAGAVALGHRWGKFETAWNKLLSSRKVDSYHWKEFNNPSPSSKYHGWSRLKRDRFVARQEKIINKNTVFRVSVGIEKAVHKEIKNRMKGITGFTSESDYSLCLRYLMFATSEQLLRVDQDHRLAILVEDGPWASGAGTAYQRVAAMTGKYKPAKHAHRLAGFGTAPKGEYRSLEGADYIAATEYARMLEGSWRPQRKVERLSLLMDQSILEGWYEGMMKEKEARRSHGRRPTNRPSSPSGGRSS